MGRQNHLEVMAKRKLLQAQHEQLLDPRVQACLNRIDQNQCTIKLGDLLGQSQNRALTCRHVQFGVTWTGLLTGNQQPLARARKVNHTGVSERKDPLGESNLGRGHWSLLRCRLRTRHAQGATQFGGIAQRAVGPEVHGPFGLGEIPAAGKAP